MEKQPSRLYVALAYNTRTKRLDNGLFFLIQDDRLFRASVSSLGSLTDIHLPEISKHETVRIEIWRTPTGATIRIVKKDVIVSVMDGHGFPWVDEYSFGLPAGYVLAGEKPVGKDSHYTFLCFKKEGEPDIHIRKDLVRGVYDLPNEKWVWSQDRLSPP